MNKRKMRMVGMALAGVLAMTPFLHGCADDNAAPDNGGQAATERQQQDTAQQNTGDQGNTVYYGQVMAVNGDEITVVLGDLKDARDGSGLQQFVSEEDEITFNKGDVVIVDETGAVVDAPTVMADQIVVMNGSGEGPDFHPEKMELLEANENGGVSSAAADNALAQ